MSGRAVFPQPCRTGLASADVLKFRGSFRHLQAVSDAMNRVDDPRTTFRCQFLTESIDVHLDEIRLAVKIGIPDVLDDLGSRSNIRSTAHQKFQQREFPAC